MYKTIKEFFLGRKYLVLAVFLLAAIVATLQEYYGGKKTFGNSPAIYTHYNNYLIFKQSFFHLKDGADLYTEYPAEYYDLYKYSPTYAFIFGTFSFLPDGLGLLIWNVLNAMAVFWGLHMLMLNTRQKIFILLFVLVELLTSLQNAQSNGLIAGLMVLAFAFMEKGKFGWACLCIALTAYVKVFGIFAFALCLLYPQRWKMVVYSIVSVMVLGALPLLLIDFQQLISCYQSWWGALQRDFVPNSLSLVGALQVWLGGITISKNAALLVGLICFVIPLLRIKVFNLLRYRLMVLSSILVWVIVFNHKAESPTFIIAMTGIGLWYVSSSLDEKWKMILAIFALVFTSLSTTDIFPDYIQDNYFDVFSVKAMAPVLIYLMMVYEFIFGFKEGKLSAPVKLTPQ
ncbi:MAG: DUF2029 domain-containing protein [Bacteroidetes bacterium]|nr:DUF2029 domain-containing protein [Bacteroidota bacterium]MBS1541020.1 DUF2029 domain-containing protein [Bacteroidota bacterium]